MKELDKQYNPADIEAKWGKKWVDNPYAADATSDKPPFCVVIPPPNVNGNLHLGHAFDNTIIDTIIRFKRMKGFEALFQPGTDHAGITTQVMVEREIREEGLTKHDLGREQFLERTWQWKEKYGGIIIGQLQRLGISADWTRTRFTMDEGLNRAVREQFVRLYHEGYIYRGERIVNWDPMSQTTLSELEVDREERPGKFYTLAYELEDGSASIQIATVRPETIFADQAIAVHPEDERFTHLIGKKARIPLTQTFVPIIADEAVEMDFGTGALKITPAHDPTDFEVGERHNLARPSVIDLDAKLATDLVPEEFRGLDRFEARKPVVAALEAAGALIEVKDHTVSLGLSERTKVPVEPIVSTQWFYKMGEHAPIVLEGLNKGEMKLHPDRYEKVNRDWLGKLRDWNISRQLWWGHQIPAWYDEQGNIYVPDVDDPMMDCTDNPKYADLNLTQDPDVFDTWFSSNLWPFSTMGWPDTEDPFFKKFYPTQLMVTGYDILFFWVTKMQLAGYGLTGEKPFTDIFLHGLVLDEKGQKMSKSKGNGIDPLEVMDEHGTDALRYAMNHASTHGQDIRWDSRRVEMGRNFNNKLWNATRFAMMNLHNEDGSEGKLDAGPPETLADRWIMSRLQQATGDITTHLENYDLGLASREVYDFVWSEFCDWYLEAAKPELREGNARTRYILKTVLTDIVKVLHPMIPFITAELYEALGNKGDVGYADYPIVDESLLDTDVNDAFKHLQNAIGAVRNLRSEANIPPGQMLPILVSGSAAPIIAENISIFTSLAKAELTDSIEGAALTQLAPDLEIKLQLEGVIDVAEYKGRQEKRLAELTKLLKMSEGKLGNTRFVDNAPEDVVAEERRRCEETKGLIEALEASISQL